MFNPLHLNYALVLLLICFPLVAFSSHNININTAASSELQTLTGIGEVKAQAIIDYRVTNGPFSVVDEIKNVTGIGDATFNNIKDHITVDDSGSGNQDAQTEVITVQTTTGDSVFIEDTTSISVNAGPDRQVIVGADTEFRTVVSGALGTPITDESIKVTWSFGNGDRKQGVNVFYNFEFPGTYVVVADAFNGIYGATDRVTVTAVPADIKLTEVTDEYIALKNNSSFEINIGNWILFSNGAQFFFPPHTIIVSGQEVLVSNKRTGLSGSDPSSVALQYPNGIVATSYQYPLFVSRPSYQAVTQISPIQNPKEEELLVSKESLITAPIASQSKNQGAVPFFVWILGIFLMTGVVGTGLVYIRHQKSEYDIEEL